MARFAFGPQQPRRRDRAIAIGVAIGLTGALALASGYGPSRVVLLPRASTHVTILAPVEQLRYLVVAPADDTRAVPRPAARIARKPQRGPTAPALVEPAPESPAVPISRPEPREADPYIPWAPPARSYGRRPVTAPNTGRFPGTATITARQQDSVLSAFETSVPHAPRMKPSDAQRDSMLRLESQRWATARDQGRLVPLGGAVPVASGGIRAPLFSPGPSAAERRRDRAVHADNLRRLQRLADRARARQDSLRRRMDSIAMLTRPNRDSSP